MWTMIWIPIFTILNTLLQSRPFITTAISIPHHPISQNQNDLPNQNQIVEYIINQTFQDLLLQAQKICHNQINLSQITTFVIYFFHNYRSYNLQPYFDQYKEWFDGIIGLSNS